MRKKELIFKIMFLVITIIILMILALDLEVQADEKKDKLLEQLESVYYINPFDKLKDNINAKKIEELFKTNDNFTIFDEEFKVTAYDLSVQSCGKKPTSRGYGITYTGFDLRGQNWKTARAIAVDPKIIPLNSIVYIEFTDEDYTKYNGIYNSVDTGRLIKGYKIDFFFEDTGETVSRQAMDFGVTKAKIIIIK